jgi:hypothetical protein
LKLGHRLHRLLAVLALGACAALLVACGGGGGSGCGGGSSANDLLKQTFSCSHSIKSGNIALSVNINAAGSKQLKGPISAQFNGPFQSLGKGKLPKFDFTVFVSAQGRQFNAGAVSTGSSGYLRYQGTTYSVPPSVFDQFRSGFEQAASKSSSTNKKSGLSRFGIDPKAWLKNPRIVGTASVAGTETKHISAQVDVSKMLDDINTLLGKAGSLGIPNATQLPKSITPAQRAQIQKAVKTATFDVYTGSSDHTLRKLAVNLVIDAASLASTSSSTAGLSNLQVSFTFQIAGLNQPQTVTAPTGARPLSELTSKLGSLGSALGGAAGGSSGSTGTTPTAPKAGNVQKYSQCLQSAGGDISKEQQCAKLLTSK